MKHMKRNKRIARLPAGQAVWAMLAGELSAHALFGMFAMPEPLLFGITLAAGAAAGMLCCCRAPKRGEMKKRPRLPAAAGGSAGRPQREEEHALLPEAARRGQDQCRQAAGELAAQLEADARRLLSQEAALQEEWARREQAMRSLLEDIKQRAERSASEARQLADKEAGTAQQAAGKWERTRCELSQELGQAAFLANLLALRLQQAPQADKESAGQAAAEGLRLLAARCVRCGKRLAGERESGAIGQAKACAGQAQAVLETFLQGLQQAPQAAAETGGQGENLRRTAEEIAGQAKALIGMLQERKAPASRTGGLREGAIEGTGLRYRLVE